MGARSAGPPAPSVARAGRRDRALEVGSSAHYDDPVYYDTAYRDRRDDVAFYERLACEGGGPVLEYGVGNGRIALPIARSGIRVTGVDLSAPMLASLADRLAGEPPAVRRRVRALRGDMREVALRERYALVLCTFNTFLHLYTRDDVERFLARARRHLAPGGRLVVDVSVPHPADLARMPDKLYRAPRFRHPRTGEIVRYGERFDYDAARQVLFMTLEFEPVAGGEPWVVPLAHRQFFPQELDALFAYNGFVVEGVEGGFAGEPLDAFSDVAVWRCRPRAGGAP